MSRARISRRTLLRGAGVAIGLPLLEAMEPVRAFASGAQAKPAPPVRLMFVYTPGGMIMNSWTPKGEGTSYTLSPTLGALERFRSEILVLTGMDSRVAESGGNGHPLAICTWLSGAGLHQRDSAGYSTDVSIDQVVARKVGESTRLASLELGVRVGTGGSHGGNISWRAPGSPMGSDGDPRAVFTRLFGDPKGDRYRRSVLDLILESANGLRRSVGAADRHKMDEYLDSVRSIEKRIQFAEKNKPPAPPKLEWLDKLPAEDQGAANQRTKGGGQAGGISFGEHIRMLQELAALGLQADSTRVVTLMYAGEDFLPPIPEAGDTLGHHGLAHWGFGRGPSEVARAVETHQKVDRWLVEQFGQLLDKLKGIRDGDGTLLDNCMIVFGSGMNSGSTHLRGDIPILLAGRGGGTLKPGRHLRYPKGTPFSNLLVALAERMGVKPERFADSTGPLPNLS